ncbi:alpha-L-fucosidase [Chitinophaga polysaccharea]|uniref:alpha-L-fucosidase n=1 Tax=Chitinophaga TaxID=79328 RepID=UPI001454F060|nr:MULTISPECIES: alpha-L-fucosidase [Chitinophaga]NLR57362.1 alpha-L-fucosidase [Chitinophaga polysaccharea]NLU92514.1 alpha-L-fucosidase [Chitinophaga sp. Ak27]
MKKVITLCLLLWAAAGHAQTNAQLDPKVLTTKAVMDQFMSLRFGMFIHWGPVSLRGTEIGWSRHVQVPAADYDTLYRAFNPTEFNADEWVKTASDAGMKYLTITAKHHDGFCLWPSAYTNYNIMATPFKKDVVGLLAKACKKYHIKFCIYYSVLDWHHPDYPIDNPNDTVNGIRKNAHMEKYVAYMKNQLAELIKKYDPYMLWFDGPWEKPWTPAMALDMYAYLKTQKKDIIINNRLGKAFSGTGADGTPHFLGDYDTPEQRIGDLNMHTPWETCMTICEQWAWKPNDKMKSLATCIHTLAKVAGGNGNLLFNVGPRPDGLMEPEQVARLKEMGSWLRQYGAAIYNTHGGPWYPNQHFAATRSGNKIYVHVLEAPGQTLNLPALPDVKITKAYIMKGAAVAIQQSAQYITLTLPATLPDTNDTVIVLETDKPSMSIAPIKI